jgi:A/G-specific adenine glycosylase
MPGPKGLIQPSARLRARVTRSLLDWYARHQRALPWRASADPYHVWVSEIMLQQTRVETVLPYYQRWLERFPTLEALAAAPPAAVLAAWEGLGYYSRARHLHRAAQQVVRDLGGQLPRTAAGLRALPGVGPYTAGAIASIAFGADEPVLDGNVKRVLARVFNYAGDVKSPAGEADLWALARALVPRGQAGDFNQALMDLGATICLPRRPACLLCPLHAVCQARQLGLQAERPVMARRAVGPHRVHAAAVVRKRGRVLIEQRPAEGGRRLLAGLWAFPSVECPRAEHDGPDCLVRALRQAHGLTAAIGPRLAQFEHGFTHFRLSLHVFEAEWQAGALRRGQPARWVRVAELDDYPMGKLDRQIARQLQAGAKHARPAVARG